MAVRPRVAPLVTGSANAVRSPEKSPRDAGRIAGTEPRRSSGHSWRALPFPSARIPPRLVQLPAGLSMPLVIEW